MSQGDRGQVTLQDQIAKLQEMILNQQKQPEVTDSFSSPSSETSSNQSSASLQSIPEQVVEEASEELSFANQQSFDLMTKSLKKTTKQSPAISIDPESKADGERADSQIAREFFKVVQYRVVVEEEKVNLSEITSSDSEQAKPPRIPMEKVNQPTSSQVVRLPPLVKPDNDESRSFSLEEIQEEPLQFSSPGLSADRPTFSIADALARRKVEEKSPLDRKKNDIFGLLPMKSIAELPDEKPGGGSGTSEDEERKFDLRKLKLPSKLATASKDGGPLSASAETSLVPELSNGFPTTSQAEATPEISHQIDAQPGGSANIPSEETKEQPRPLLARPLGLKRRTLDSDLNVGRGLEDLGSLIPKRMPAGEETIPEMPLRLTKHDSVMSPVPKQVLPMDEVETHSTCARQDEGEFEKKLTRQGTKKFKKKKKRLGKIVRASSKEETLKFSSLTTPGIAMKGKDRQSAVIGPLQSADLLMGAQDNQEQSPDPASPDLVTPDRVSPDFRQPAEGLNSQNDQPKVLPREQQPQKDSTLLQLEAVLSSKQPVLKSSPSFDGSGGQGSSRKMQSAASKDLKKLISSQRPPPLNYGRPNPLLDIEEDKESDSVSKDSISAIKSEDLLKDLSRKIYVLSERSKEDSEENLPVIPLVKQKTSSYKLDTFFPAMQGVAEIKQPPDTKEAKKNTVKRRISNGLAPFIKRERTSSTYKKRKQL